MTRGGVLGVGGVPNRINTPLPETFRGTYVAHKQHVAWERAGRGGTTCTNLRLSSPVPLTGVCQPADAAGGGTAPVPTRGGGQPRGGLSRERSRMGTDPPWGTQAAWEPTSTAVLPGSSERRTRPERDRSTNCKAICICCSFASWCCESQEGALSKITAVCIRTPLLSYRLFLA